MMKKMSLGLTVFILIFSIMCLTGCGKNNTADEGTDETEATTEMTEEESGGGDKADEGYNDEDTDEENTEEAEDNESGADGDNAGNSSDNDTGSGTDSIGNSGTGNDTGDPTENGSMETGDDAIDGGTITNRAGSLFEGSDGIGMRGAENIRGNSLLY